jgi:hypothetical protein
MRQLYPREGASAAQSVHALFQTVGAVVKDDEGLPPARSVGAEKPSGQGGLSVWDLQLFDGRVEQRGRCGPTVGVLLPAGQDPFGLFGAVQTTYGRAQIAGRPQVGLTRADVPVLAGGLDRERSRLDAGIVIGPIGGLEIARFDLRQNRQELPGDLRPDSSRSPGRCEP